MTRHFPNKSVKQGSLEGACRDRPEYYARVRQDSCGSHAHVMRNAPITILASNMPRIKGGVSSNLSFPFLCTHCAKTNALCKNCATPTHTTNSRMHKCLLLASYMVHTVAPNPMQGPGSCLFMPSFAANICNLILLDACPWLA